MPIYNKLVRDKILEVIEAKGLSYHAHILEPSELVKAIKAKMIEEATEFYEAQIKKIVLKSSQTYWSSFIWLSVC